ncbi:MAG: SDR family oxidoreductase [Actinomycetia bacterium]|nr:SDR family oxidoreductase [Actinomycetes bacterium]
MDLGIAGKRAAVAASSGGLGRGIALALGQAGCEVVVSGRDADRLATAAADVANSHPITADVSTVEGALAFVEDARTELGGIDILVTNGGGPPPGTFASTPWEDYQPAIERSLLAMAAMVHECVPAMRENQWGRVLAITSVSVRQPIPNLILSNTARAGLTGFLKTVALEVAGDGITVNTIQPGLHATDRVQQIYGGDTSGAAAAIPVGFVGDPDDFGRAGAFLCSESAKFITGASLNVDGGTYSALQ